MYVYAYMHIHMYTCIIYIHICMIHISCEEGRVMYDIKDAEAPQPSYPLHSLQCVHSAATRLLTWARGGSALDV